MDNSYDLQHYIALRVRQLRQNKKLSQEKLSELAGLSDKYIHNIENQSFNLKIQTLEKIIEALDLTPEIFFNFKTTNPHLLDAIDRLHQLPTEVQDELIEAFNQILKQVITARNREWDRTQNF